MKELFKLYTIDKYNIFILKVTEEKRIKNRICYRILNCVLLSECLLMNELVNHDIFYFD